MQNALRELVTEKRYEAITVVDILERADVGRSTFYAHFTDKDDLLLSALDHISRALEAELTATGALVVEPLFRHAGQQIELYRALSRGPAGQLFLRELRGHLARRLAAGYTVEATRAEIALRAQFEAGAILAALTWWLDNPTDLTPEEAARAVERLRR